MDAAGLLRIAEHNRRAVREGDRPIVTVCSGRPQPFAECVCRVIANDRLSCVAEMGVWLYDPSCNAFLRDPGITADDLAGVARMTAWIERELSPRGVVIQPGKSASISLWHPDTPTLMALMPQLREVIDAHRWPLRVSNTVAWINLDLRHVSKATGIDRLYARHGLTRERTLGIGDTLGDLAIRERVGVFACPANADERLKPHADYVSPHAEIAGVLDILERLGR